MLVWLARVRTGTSRRRRPKGEMRAPASRCRAPVSPGPLWETTSRPPAALPAERQDRGGTGHAMLVQLTPAEEDVRRERADPRNAALFAKRVHCLRRAAPLDSRFPSGVRG